MAAENVELDNLLLEAKSARIKAEKTATSATSKLSKLESRLQVAELEAERSQRDVEALQTERRLLIARAMQAEARVRALADAADADDGRVSGGAAQRKAALAAAQRGRWRPEVETADAAVQAGGEAAMAGDGVASSTRIAGEAVRGLLRGAGVGTEAFEPSDLAAALGELHAWLPELGAGADLAAGPGEDERRLVESINSLLEDLVERWSAMAAELKQAQVGGWGV